MDRHHSFRDASEMENSVALTRAIPRPRSLCDNKLLSVHQVNGHVTDRPPVPPHRNGQPPQRPPPVPTRPPRSVEMPTKFRGSWPYAMTPTWNTADPDLTPYPPPLSSADKAPSMAGLLNTTVPQRLVVTRPIRGGQHTPTRHSLRHSRMISLSQQGRGQPPLFAIDSCQTVSLFFFFVVHRHPFFTRPPPPMRGTPESGANEETTNVLMAFISSAADRWLNAGCFLPSQKAENKQKP